MSTTLGYAPHIQGVKELGDVEEDIGLIRLHRAFIAGGVAACGAVTVTHGFETIKIRCASLLCFPSPIR